MSSQDDILLENLSLKDLLFTAKTHECSIVNLTSNKVPLFRKPGGLELHTFDDSLIDELTFFQWLKSVFNDGEIQQINSGRNLTKLVDYSFARVSISGFISLQGLSLSIKFLPDKIPTMEDLGIPVAVKSMCECSAGLIIISGVVGSGKITTLASLINGISKDKIRQVFIIEDVLSYIYQDSPSLIQHLIIGTHISNVEEGVKTALRNDSDIIVINSLVDRLTIDWAIHAAKHGNLVVLSMQSKNAIAVIEEIYSLYGNQEQDFIRFSLANNLKVVLAQQLVSTITGKYKRAVIFDMLLPPVIPNSDFSSALITANKNQLLLLMQRSEYGMLTMEKELKKLLDANRITQETFNTVHDELRR